MKKLWADRAWDDYLYWQTQDKKTLKRINELIKSIEREGLSQGILTPRLFSKLGIKRPTWEIDPLGNSFGAGGLFLTLTETTVFLKLFQVFSSYNATEIFFCGNIRQK